VKLCFKLTSVIIFAFALSFSAFAQADTFLGQFTNSAFDSFVGSISGNGRFVVFESRGNLATENPRNADGNLEIFLWDYAQRRIFQITDTKSLLFNPDGSASTPSNIRVEIINTHPVISNDGKWIAFSSNATIAFPGDATHPPIVSATNPGQFDANAFSAPTPTPTPTPTTSPSPTPTVSPTPTPTPAANSLSNDGNLEMWVYQIPSYSDVADLSAGDEVGLVNLAPFNADGSPTGGAFTPVTNSFPSQIPRAGSALQYPIVANDNHDASLSDDGHALAFVSTRDLVPAIGNAFPADDNDEIFTYIQGSGLNQVTKTSRGAPANPIYNKNPTISGPGTRIVFSSTGDNPVVGMTGGSNPANSINEEIFYTDIGATGAPTGTSKQITTTTPTQTQVVVNILDPGRRMSRDGRYIAFDSFADLAGNSAVQTSFALYLYDTTTNTFRQIGPRSNTDSAATGGDIAHYPGFTDYDGGGVATTLVLETRLNIKADGTIPATATDGLNSDPTRPVQIYSFPIAATGPAAIFRRLTTLPISQTFLASTQPFPSNSQERIAFSLSLTEPGTGNPDFSSEGYYLLQPEATTTGTATMSFFTGASRLAVTASPTPTPSPTATPTPSPSVTPTPQTPSSVVGFAPGMLAFVDFSTALTPAVTPRTAVGSLSRSFTLPIELSGVSVSINGAACGLKAVTSQSIQFVVPPGLASDAAGKSYPIVVNNNGQVIKGTVAIVPARPDVFTNLDPPGPGGRARMLNVTNRVATHEPFTLFTIRLRGGQRVSSRMRLYFTGAASATTTATYSVRIGSATASGTGILTAPALAEPGVYFIEFSMPSTITGLGDQPVVVTGTVGGVDFVSRLDDTAPKMFVVGG
jgi:hypothetical protein